MSHGMEVSILIVSYNTREMTLACLDSVYATTSDVSFEVVLVDNASVDGSADAIAQRFPQVRLIRPEQNVGFAAANNLAAKQAGGKYLLLLNPDTVVLDGAVERMVRFADGRPDVGAVGGRTLYADGSLNPTSCFGVPTLWSSFCRGTGLSSLLAGSRWFNPEDIGGWQRDTVRDVGVITGCFLLIPKALWDQLGGFDESFFMYSEDTDLSYRVWQSGRRCVHLPDATIIHYGGGSEHCRAEKMVKVFRAKGQFFWKHWRRPAAILGEAMLDLCALTRAVAYRAGSVLEPRHAAKHRQWRDVWRRRAEWHARNSSGKGPASKAGGGRSNALAVTRDRA